MKKLRDYTLKSLMLLILSFVSIASIQANGKLTGLIMDKEFDEPLTGATVQLFGTDVGAVTGLDGLYELKNIKPGEYTVVMKFLSYKTLTFNNVKVLNGKTTTLNATMEPDATMLEGVIVTAERERNNQVAMLEMTKQSLVVQTGISAQQISKTQDRDASEVIKRVPGISIIDGKFVMVRGLSQRYNNVWINNSAVPSSEADSRAFSFDIIPSSQLDNMVIVKSPSPEIPADFSGGFIKIMTKDIPEENSFSLSLGGTVNTETQFKDFKYNKGGATDFLGFDNGYRSMSGGIKQSMNTFDGKAVDLLSNGLNNDWSIKNKKPVANTSISGSMSRVWDLVENQKLALIASLNYSDSYRTYDNMINNLFGTYDSYKDQSNYLRKSIDDQYNHDVRIGAMANLTYVPKKTHHKYEFKNIFNQLGKDRYTERTGMNAQSELENNYEYYYQSRTTYNGQVTGKYTYDKSKLDWNVGYAYANRNVPDRRRITYTESPEREGELFLKNGNDISREWTMLNEHIISAGANYDREFEIWSLNPTLKAGVFGEYRTRTYDTREFIYNWNYYNNTLPRDFRYLDPQNELLVDANYGYDKLHLFEEANMRNNYSGNNGIYSGYLGLNVPIQRFNIYAGVRYEYNRMELISNTRDDVESPESRFYNYPDLFPSLNASYKLTEKQQLRLAYGKSINRPEFREVSSSVYDDFELASPVMGNPDLKPAYIQNIDFRYEWYPSQGESVSLALFYKNFKNPIEWTYTVSGGTSHVYSFENAKSANSYGIELDVSKNLDFIGMRDFSWTFNGAIIQSEVMFAKGSLESNRPMQGQSPYLINTGLFYNNDKLKLNAALLYNRIGKRIVGVGRNAGASGGGDETNNTPSSYEMPRNSIDLTLSKKFGALEIKAGVKDLLAEKVQFIQYAKAEIDGKIVSRRQVAKEFRPGRQFNLSMSYTF